MTEKIATPTTDIVRARYHLATIGDNIPSEIADRSRPVADAEFDSWLAQLKAEIRAEIEAENEVTKAPALDPRTTPVAEIYERSPYAGLILAALDHRPGESTSADFQRGYFASLEVSRIRGAEALATFVAPSTLSANQGEWEYGWRSFFPDGEEYEWLATHSRADAEQQIRDYQEDEDARFVDEAGVSGKLTYSLWRRRKAAAGPWERVEVATDEQH